VSRPNDRMSGVPDSKKAEKDEFLIDCGKSCNDDDEKTASGRPFQT